MGLLATQSPDVAAQDVSLVYAGEGESGEEGGGGECVSIVQALRYSLLSYRGLLLTAGPCRTAQRGRRATGCVAPGTCGGISPTAICRT